APADQELFALGGDEFTIDNAEYEEEEEPKYFYFNMIKTIQDLTQRFRAKENEFKTYLGPNYADFARAIKEMENWLVWIGYEKDELPQSWVYREQYMEGNFREAFKDKPEAKGFGQFGRCHITRVTKVGDCGFAFFSSLNKRIITKMPELENKLSSIGIFYGGLDNQNKLNDNGNVSDLIRLTDKGTANLFMDLHEYGDEMLRTKFSSVIVVKSNRYKENMDDILDGDYEFDYEEETDFSFSFDFNVISRRWNDLYDFGNRTYFNSLSPDFMTFELGMTATVDRAVNNIAFGILPMKTNVYTDSINSSLGGWNFRYTWGKDLIRSKTLELTPELGIGYSLVRYTEERKTAESTLLGTPYFSEFRNPAFLFDARVNFGVIVGITEFRFLAGYTYDVSKGAWLQGKNPINNGPQTKFTGFYQGVGASIRFNSKL
ncbi:MAG: hypothetical protein LPK45_00745, partial [Bacteroidota bacterium]|nr:hypothetical protein [Bacteroidota bacterium]MDX5429552.1 hypothetical protein [Bacteroidota bacterium]MDX5468339.1 hypothetical protein [Bacteroidota bacterium]